MLMGNYRLFMNLIPVVNAMQKQFGWVFFVGLLLVVLWLLVGTGDVVLAEENTPSDDAVNQVASELFCPICENVPLDECRTEACEQWKDLIRQQLADGWTEDEIKAYFVAQYGDRVLAKPPRRGLNWLLYALPPLIILGGLLLVILTLKGSPVKGNDNDFSIDPYRERVERDLVAEEKQDG